MWGGGAHGTVYVKLRFEVSVVTFTREMDVGRQKLCYNCDFELSVATFTREMDVGRQKLW